MVEACRGEGEHFRENLYIISSMLRSFKKSTNNQNKPYGNMFVRFYENYTDDNQQYIVVKSYVLR